MFKVTQWNFHHGGNLVDSALSINLGHTSPALDKDKVNTHLLSSIAWEPKQSKTVLCPSGLRKTQKRLCFGLLPPSRQSPSRKGTKKHILPFPSQPKRCVFFPHPSPHPPRPGSYLLASGKLGHLVLTLMSPLHSSTVCLPGGLAKRLLPPPHSSAQRQP